MSLSFAKLRTVLCTVLCICSLGAAICLCAAVFSDYDPYLHHFAAGSPLAAAAVIVSLLGTALSLVLCLFVHAKKIRSVPSYSLPAVFTGTLLGFLLLVAFIFEIPSADSWLERIQLALMALAACRFLLAAQKDTSRSPVGALLSIAPILYAFLSVMTIYFEKSMAMNSPLKAWYLMAYIAASLFFTAEARETLGRIHPMSYCLFAGLCVSITGAVGLSHIAVTLQSNVSPLTLRDAAVLTVTASFAAVRLFSLQNVPAPAAEPVEDEAAEQEGNSAAEKTEEPKS